MSRPALLAALFAGAAAISGFTILQGGAPFDEGIVLQAALDQPPPGRINLTWTGATAATVDVIRGAALVATTPNDEQHDDRPTPAQAGELDEQQVLHR